MQETKVAPHDVYVREELKLTWEALLFLVCSISTASTTQNVIFSDMTAEQQALKVQQMLFM